MASEATIARDLRDARFQDAFRIPPAIDPSTMGQRGSGVDALKRVEKVPMPTSGGSNVQNPWSARSGLEKQIPKLGDMLDDSAGRRKLPNGQQYLKKAADHSMLLKP